MPKNKKPHTRPVKPVEIRHPEDSDLVAGDVIDMLGKTTTLYRDRWGTYRLLLPNNELHVFYFDEGRSTKRRTIWLQIDDAYRAGWHPVYFDENYGQVCERKPAAK